MTTEEELFQLWPQLRERLQGKHLLGESGGSLSLRIPGTDAIWFGSVAETTPRRILWRGGIPASGVAEHHAAVYTARQDVSTITIGGGVYGRCLADFGGVIPQVFDEQARHLGRMGPAVTEVRRIAHSLREGGSVVLMQGLPVCLGMTPTRMALNAELFEKCAKAYVLAVSSGARVKSLPWIVPFIANGRLRKDTRRAIQRLQQGLLPEETKGY
jgi:ribulose-5-phosphate 4-epimerase/fuculose-1-phosphate aldolase